MTSGRCLKSHHILHPTEGVTYDLLKSGMWNHEIRTVLWVYVSYLVRNPWGGGRAPGRVGWGFAKVGLTSQELLGVEREEEAAPQPPFAC